MSELRPPGAACRAPLRRFAITTAFVACLGSIGCVARNDTTPTTSSEASSHDIPCDAKQVLQSVCQQCHSDPPQNSAPFPLVTYEDTQVLLSGKPIWTYMRTVLEAGVMPLPPVTIGQSDAAALLRWLNAGAPPRTAADVCTAPTVDPAEAGADATDGGATLESSDEQGDAGGAADDVLGASSETSDADDPDDAAPD